MSTFTYPDGTQLTSTALTDNQVESVMQLVTAQMLGILTAPIPPDKLSVLPPPLATEYTTNPPNPWTVTLTLVTGQFLARASSLINLYAGLLVVGTGIPDNTFITGFMPGSKVVLSNPASVSEDQLVTVFDLKTYYKVRIGWQKQGQPGPPIDEDTVTIRCDCADDDFSRLRDCVDATSGILNVTTDVYTVVWRVYWTFYGPSGIDRARAVRSALVTIQQFADILATCNLYVNPSIARPVRVPEENGTGQWWERNDLVVEFNEKVTETYTVGTVTNVDVSIYDSSGEQEVIHIVS